MEKTIQYLLVEDDDSHAMITMRSLRSNSVPNNVDRVADGAEALAYLRKEGPYANRPRPDVILLDLKLPKVDGHEVLANVKDDPELRLIPVVVLTTSDADNDRLQAYKHHVNSYLVKPLDFKSYKAMADELVEYWGVWNRPALGRRNPPPTRAECA